MPHGTGTTLLLQVAVMLAAGVLLGQLARRLRLPALFGELVGGILLGPTLLGAVAPGAPLLAMTEGAPLLRMTGGAATLLRMAAP